MAKFKIQKKIDINGNTEDIELDGYQEEITSTNKLSSDLVDDNNSTNKFVTSSEKETWNNKANVSDIPTKTSQLTNDSGFSTFSGSYNDLTNKPINLVTTDTGQTISGNKIFEKGIEIVKAGIIQTNPFLQFTTSDGGATIQYNGTDLVILRNLNTAITLLKNNTRNIAYLEEIPTDYTTFEEASTEVEQTFLDNYYTKAQLYPVGSIYMSVNSTSPASFLGGTWERLKDRFLLGAGDTYSNGATGGESSHKLTVSEMPSHAHTGLKWQNNSASTWSLTADGSGGGRLKASTTWDGGGSNQFTTGSTGSGASHNNMPPYLVVYMWKRTA